ncbi:hypothetical protein K1T71_006731 [Dendrolimus kikuchii]|uniref:Uncharacterized protein n=1 Tax=Dendrolimus kikuchii TaxID=765133 RepID=A0ACC1D1V0_9NEOP|nr:hypothetical protein K1T71_006731 [Dendrolimus kikuchii]
MSLWRRLISPTLFSRKFQEAVTRRSLHNVVFKNVNITSRSIKLYPENLTHNTVRFKSKKHQIDLENEDDLKFYEDDTSLSKDSKVVKFNTTSMRMDIILKSGLGIARNKIETLFYESKIRINGTKVLKKSTAVKIGDEVDIIKMVSPKNPNHLYVARVEILGITPSEDNISVTARRFKNLLIENYNSDPHKAASSEA